MAVDTFDEQWVELADRANDGLDIRLYWNRGDGRVKVAVTSHPHGSGRRAARRARRRDDGVPPPLRVPRAGIPGGTRGAAPRLGTRAWSRTLTS